MMSDTTVDVEEIEAPLSALEIMIDRAVALYGVRITDNIDPSRLSSPQSRARIVGNALMEHGDLRAFVIGRELIAASGL